MKKGWIIVVVILLVYLVLMIVLFSDKGDNKNKPTKQEKQTIEKYFERKREIITKEEVKPNNTGMEVVDQELQIIGVSDFTDFIPATYNIQNLSDNNVSYFKRYVLSGKDLDNLTVNQKVEFDFDGDGDLEQLLLISNVDDESARGWISAVYYIDEKINKIKLVKYSMYEQSNIKFELANIADLNNDGRYEVLLKMLPSNGECYDLYTLEGNIYKPVVICDQPTV